MSEFSPPQNPSEDPPQRLPERRTDGGTVRQAPEEPAEQVSLEEMMERLQRSGAGESRSGRRRRSSQGKRSASGSSPSQTEEPAPRESRSGEAALPLPKAVLPPPRRQDAEAANFRERRDFGAAGRKKRWLIYSLIGLLAVAGLVWLGIRMLNRWRIEGEGFRVNAGRRVSELADRRVSFSRFRQAGADQLNIASFSLAPARQDLLETALASDLTVDLAAGSWLADEWSVRSLRIKKADFAFKPNKPLDEQTIMGSTPAPVDRGAPTAGGFRIGLTSDPASVEVEAGRFDELNLTWPGPGGQPESLNGLEGNFRLVDRENLQMEMVGGVLDTAAWSPMPVRQVNARLRGTALEIVSARLGFTAEHEIRVSGTADLTPAGKIQLKVDIGQILLKHLLPASWSFAVLGSFESQGGSWVSSIQSGPPATLTGPIRVRGLVLRNLPFVDKIASLLNKPELSLMEFPTLTGNFAWTPEATRLTNLSAVSTDGLLRFKGGVTVTPGDTISGQLTFEANDAIFAGLPAESVTSFTPSEEGWRALTVTLGGREDALTDDIGIANPIILKTRPTAIPANDPSLEIPRMTLPPGVKVPAPAATPAPAPIPAATAPAAVPPVRRAPVPARPQPSDAELERGFNELLGR